MYYSKWTVATLSLSVIVAIGTSSASAKATTNVTPELFQWQSSPDGASVAMSSTADGYCFLTGVGGAFQGSGDELGITDSNGVWLLGGSASSSGIKAEAHCVPWSNIPQSNITSERWSSSAWEWAGAANFDGPYWGWRDFVFGAPTSVCTIGGVGGNFQNGLQDYVGLDPLAQATSAGDWDLHLQSDDANDGQSTGGYGNCVNYDNVPVYPSASIRMTAGGTVDLGSTNGGQTVCAISQVGGGMQGWGDFVHIVIVDNGTGERWSLEGTGSALAAARCWNL
jgi:hypothetical protein